MYKIKQIPEDFIVNEVMKLPKSKGGFSYFLLSKKNKSTFDAIDFIALKFNIPKKRISFSGLKDKNAFTSQYISISNLDKAYNKDFDFIEIKLTFIGSFDKSVYIGQHLRNEFIITVRNLDKKYKKISFIENYFDKQRFSKHNIEVGRAILHKDFSLACKTLGYFDVKDPISFLREKYGKNLRFFINSYQSYLFNLVLCRVLKAKKGCRILNSESLSFVFCLNKGSNIEIPLINFDSKIKNGDLNKFYDIILRKEGIKKEDFLIRQIPEIVSAGTTRDSIVGVKWKSLRYLEDELNKGKIKAVLCFYLPKGSFATILVKKMFN